MSCHSLRQRPHRAYIAATGRRSYAPELGLVPVPSVLAVFRAPDRGITSSKTSPEPVAPIKKMDFKLLSITEPEVSKVARSTPYLASATPNLSHRIGGSEANLRKIEAQTAISHEHAQLH